MAEDEEFEIPTKPEDLSSRSTKHPYHVDTETNIENYSEGQLNKIIDQLATKMKKSTTLNIIEHAQFDLIWSLLS